MLYAYSVLEVSARIVALSPGFTLDAVHALDAALVLEAHSHVPSAHRSCARPRKLSCQGGLLLRKASTSTQLSAP